MSTQNILIAHPASAHELGTIKAFFEANKIKFEIAKESPYNQEFVNKIKKSRQEFEQGDFISIQQSDLKNFLGI